MQLSASPEWLPFDLTDDPDGVRFLRLTEEAFAGASFLDGRILTPSSVFQALTWLDIGRAAVPARRRHYIFHIGHVGSTLLSRLIGAAPGAFSVREPAILRALAGRTHEAAPFGARLRLIGDLLARTFHDDQTAVIKATSFVSEIGPTLLGAHPGARALLMAVTPEVYMAGVLGGPNSAKELKAMAGARAARLSRRLGAPVSSDLVMGATAAMSWLSEIAALVAIETQHPGAAAWINFETFLRRPDEELERALAHLDLPMAAAARRAIAGGPLMTRYSKDPQHAYDAETRRQVLEAARSAHGAEIRAGMAWLNEVGAAFPAARQAMQRAALALR